MSAKFESMLSEHFKQSEIQELKNRPDYNEARLKVKQLQANHMLDDLGSRVHNEIQDRSLSLNERFERFKASIYVPLSVSNESINQFDTKEYIKNKKHSLREQFLTRLAG